MATRTTGIDFLDVLNVPGEKETLQDLTIYMLALDSYPDQVVGKPQLSFQQHLQNLIHAESRRLAGNLQS
jgi:hypothetical protein